jgi:hypothetical protein
VLFEVGGGVLLGCSDVGAESTLLAMDNDSTATGSFLSSVSEDTVHLDVLKALLENLARVVLANAANKSNITIEVCLSQDMVAGTSRVQGRTTGGDLFVFSSEYLIVNSNVRLSDEGGLSVLEAVLLVKDIFVILNGDVKQGVLDYNEGDLLSLH